MKIYAVILGLTLPVFLISVAMFFPLLLAWQANEPEIIQRSFLYPMLLGMVLSLVVFAIFFLIIRRHGVVVSVREGLLLVSVSWLLSALVASFPLYLSRALPNFYDAFFESMSGFTTTGATVLSQLDSLSPALILWRAITHWLGGMGIVMLSIAVAPLLGFGSFQLMKAEVPGLELDRLTFRISHTAIIFWAIYCVLTLVEIILLRWAGMNWFEAVVHSFATLATGGFSSRDASIAAFQSPTIEWIITVFMLLAGCNFIAYFYLLRRRRKMLTTNSELKAYLIIVLLFTAIIAVLLVASGDLWSDSIRLAAFQVASILTTTGFVSADYQLWSEEAKYFIFILMFVGGCAGSTGGGIKVVRIIVAGKKVLGSMRRSIDPRVYSTVRLNGQVITEETIDKVTSFLLLYLLLLVATSLVVTIFSGVDLTSALSTALATLGNIGPGFAAVGPVENYSFYPDVVKLWLSLMMLMGRLEIFTVLLLFSGNFWKKF